MAAPPESGNACEICSDDFCETSRSVGAIPCGHCYHVNCLASWFNTQRVQNNPTTCPKCRAPANVSQIIRLFLFGSSSEDTIKTVSGVNGNGSVTNSTVPGVNSASARRLVRSAPLVTRYEQRFEQRFKQRFEAGRHRFAAGQQRFEAGRQRFEAGWQRLESGWQQLEADRHRFEAGQQLSGWQRLEAGWQQLEAGRHRFEAARHRFAAGQQRFEAGRQRFEAGRQRFQAGRQKAQAARREAQAARREVQAVRERVAQRREEAEAHYRRDGEFMFRQIKDMVLRAATQLVQKWK